MVLYNQLNQRPTPHLAHVVSWVMICNNANKHLTNGNWADLQGLIDDLFEIDMDAVVWVGSNYANVRNQHVKHVTYMGNNLVNLNRAKKRRNFKIAIIAINTVPDTL